MKERKKEKKRIEYFKYNSTSSLSDSIMSSKHTVKIKNKKKKTFIVFLVQDISYKALSQSDINEIEILGSRAQA